LLLSDGSLKSINRALRVYEGVRKERATYSDKSSKERKFRRIYAVSRKRTIKMEGKADCDAS
jgi:hypothetical protein